MGQMRQYIVNRREELKAYASRFNQPDATNLENTIEQIFKLILAEFDKMESDLWQNIGKPDQRSEFEKVFGKGILGK